MNIIKQTLCLAAALTFSAFIPQTVDNYAVATAARSNDMTETKIPVGNFTEVTLIGHYKVIYTQGKSCQVTIRAPRNTDIMQDISAEVKKGALTVSTKQIAGVRVINNNRRDSITVYVTSPTLTKASLIGSGDFIANKPIDADRLQIVLHGSGDIKFNTINCNSINASLNGSGYISMKKVETGTKAIITLNGSGDFDIDCLTAVNAGVSLNGSGDLNLKNLECSNASINLNGVGDMKVAAVTTQNASARLHGSGNLSIHLQECDNLDTGMTGTGDITLSGTTNTYRKTKSKMGDIHDSRLKYNKIVDSQSYKSSKTTKTPHSPGKIEAQP